MLPGQRKTLICFKQNTFFISNSYRGALKPANPVTHGHCISPHNCRGDGARERTWGLTTAQDFNGGGGAPEANHHIWILLPIQITSKVLHSDRTPPAGTQPLWHPQLLSWGRDNRQLLKLHSVRGGRTHWKVRTWPKIFIWFKERLNNSTCLSAPPCHCCLTTSVSAVTSRPSACAFTSYKT